MKLEQVMSRIAKLLKLGGSDNEHEAASAVGRAQALMTEHNVTDAMLDVEEQEDPEQDIENWEDPLEGVRAVWRSLLVRSLCAANGCHYYVSKKHDPTKAGRYRYHLIGRGSDAQAVRYLFGYCVNEIEALTKKKRGNGPAWLEQYRQGCVDAIAASIDRQKNAAYEKLRDAAHGTVALVRTEDAIVVIEERTTAAAIWGQDNLGLRATRGNKKPIEIPDARKHGAKDGKNIYPTGKTRSIDGGPKRQIAG